MHAHERREGCLLSATYMRIREGSLRRRLFSYIGPQVGGEVELAATCMVRVAGEDDIMSSAPAPTAYQTRRQQRARAGKGHTKQRDAIVPRDLFPPPGLPQGFVRKHAAASVLSCNQS